MNGLRRSEAFTLVELLIVIIIVGILAAVAIPQFGNSSQDARLAALDANLNNVRTAIELYFHQHTSVYPGGAVKTHKTASGTPAHTDAADAFAKQLTMYSDSAGNTSEVKDTANFPYGPYLKWGMPENPLPASGATASSVTVSADIGPLTADGSPTTGWKFSTETGQFIANSATYQSR